MGKTKTNKKRFRKSKLPAASNKVDKAQNVNIVSLNKRVRRLEWGAECKYNLLTNELFSNITKTPQTKLLNALSRGTTIQTRVGDSITAKSLLIKGILTCGMGASPWASAVRLIVIRVNEPAFGTTLPLNAASPAAGYLFMNNVTTSDIYVNQMYNFNNNNIKNKFTILYDKVHLLLQNDANVPAFKMINKKFRLGNVKCSYKGGNSGTGGDIDKYQYWIAAFTDNTTAGVNFRYDSCFYFTDD